MKQKKGIKFNFDLSKCDYKIDVLQGRLLEFYLRADRRFRQAFNLNYTNDFIQFIKDKSELTEPIHISTMGQIRGGKSETMVTICLIHNACYGNKFTIDYICANVFEFLEKLKTFPEHKLKNRIFLVDEEKQAVFGVGSMAKKTKVQDVQNIIAKNNISTIMINPNSWANSDAHYGLRAFGRCFNTKTNRFMLYNLMEKGRGSELPLGNVYLPIFTAVLPKEDGEKLRKQYLAKKDKWISQEMRGEGDVLAEIKKESAKKLIKDEKYLTLTKKKDRIAYVSQVMGSEWTKGEIEEIETLTNLIRDGVL